MATSFILALSGHHAHRPECPLSGVKRTCPFALQMSAYDPKADIVCTRLNISAKKRPRLVAGSGTREGASRRTPSLNRMMSILSVTPSLLV